MRELVLTEIQQISGASFAGYLGTIGGVIGAVMAVPASAATFTYLNATLPLNPYTFQYIAAIQFAGSATGAWVGVYIGSKIDRLIDNADARQQPTYTL